MGAGASIPASDNGVVSNGLSAKTRPALTLKEFSTPTTMALDGLLLSYCDEFLNACGGRPALTGLTTREVVKRFIIPFTLTSQVSYCRHMRDCQHPAAQSAPEYFVVHCWDDLFLDSIDALVEELGSSPVSLWWDIFSLSQHNRLDPNSECDLGDHWFATSLLRGLQSIGRVVCLCSRWDVSVQSMPTLFTRSWCILEYFLAVHYRIPITLALSPSCKTLLIACAKQHGYTLWLGWKDKLSVECSVSSREEDRLRIIDRLESKFNCRVVCSRIFDSFCQVSSLWLLKQLPAILPEKSSQRKLSDVELSLVIYQILSSLQLQSNRPVEAVVSSQSSVTLAKDWFGNDSLEACTALLNHSRVLQRAERSQEALQAAQQCRSIVSAISNCKSKVIPPEALDVQSEADLFVADLLLRAQDWSACEEVLSSGLLASESQAKPDQVIRGQILLAKAAAAKGDVQSLASAAAQFKSCLAICKSAFGPCHDLTIECVRGLLLTTLQLQSEGYQSLTPLPSIESFDDTTKSMAVLEESSEPRALFMSCRRLAATHWGADDSRTLSLLSSVAELLVRMDSLLSHENSSQSTATATISSGLNREQRARILDAEALFVECMQVKTSRLGADHPSTLSASLSLSKFYVDQRSFVKAKQLLLATLTIAQRAFSAAHPFSMSVSHLLVSVHKELQELDAAAVLSEQMLQVYRNTLSASSPVTLAAIAQLADLYFQQQQFALAIEYYLENYQLKNRLFGAEDSKTLTALGKLALCYEKLQQYDKAGTLFAVYWSALAKTLGERHPKVVAVKKNLELIQSLKSNKNQS